MQTEFPLAPALIDAATTWPTYPSTMTRTATTWPDGSTRAPSIVFDCNRCSHCDGALYPPDQLNPVIRHLLEQHDYRMNGTLKEPT